MASRPIKENVGFYKIPWSTVDISFPHVIVDAYSKWPEVLEMPNTTAEETVKQLRSVIARMGIPEQIVSDNGPQFIAELFQTFTRTNGIRHVTGAPYHPATNGLAERLVRSFKQALKVDKSDISPQTKLDRFLLAYRSTPHATTTQPSMADVWTKSENQDGFGETGYPEDGRRQADAEYECAL